MIWLCRIVHMHRTISRGGRARPAADPPTEADRDLVVAQIIAQFRTSLGELRCVASERVVRQGVSMSHLHLMSMLHRHGEMPMSRVAELLDVSDSNATGLIDRMEERGIVERVRHPEDRRVVHVRVSDAGRRILADVEILRDDLVLRVLARLDTPRLVRLGQAMEDVRGAIEAIATDEPGLFAHNHPHPHDAGVGASARPAAEH
jgi:DNA-binding MarR family transcriptional regulator